MSFVLKWETKQTLGRDTVQTNTRVLFYSFPKPYSSYPRHFPFRKKTAQDVIIQTVYQKLLENRNMRSFFDPHLLNSKKPRHISSFMLLIPPWICKRLFSRQQPPWSSQFTHLSHLRNLDSATQVYYKDFSLLSLPTILI